MTQFFQPDLGQDIDNPFIRDGADKLVRRSYWLDMNDRTLVMVMTNDGIAKQHFVEFNGQPVKSVKTAFKKAVSLSKLAGKVSPHTLRHTAATWLMQIGVSTWDAAGFLGMSEKTLRDVYGHHHPDYLQGAAKAIGAKKPVSLVKSLVRPHQRRPLAPQHIENTGGPGRTRTSNQTVMSGRL